MGGSKRVDLVDGAKMEEPISTSLWAS